MATTCPSCGGAGSTSHPATTANTCDGIGRVRGRKEVEIDLPAGVDDGFRIRKDGFGDVPLSGAGTPGSLYVRINVAPSRIWRRQGSTLFYPATIPFHTAVLGGKVRVPTLDGAVEVRVPAGTQVGEEMILPGRGVPSPTRRGQKGRSDGSIRGQHAAFAHQATARNPAAVRRRGGRTYVRIKRQQRRISWTVDEQGLQGDSYRTIGVCVVSKRKGFFGFIRREAARRS